ncbi:hypothetical protein SBA3_3000017 [Candidatus Sulfopaludibacter sp. SbA3]|nr:hypothetical protein SBA3_3000017 [Candidatus Sulfopaludibacter sp. SbA3]
MARIDSSFVAIQTPVIAAGVVAPQRVAAGLLGAFGVLAIFLAAVLREVLRMRWRAWCAAGEGRPLWR